MTFSEKLRRSVHSIWQAQLTHPFVVALGKGSLPRKKFQYYILQDARYLEELARVFSLGAQRASDADTALRFAQLVENTIVVERGLHESYAKHWKISSQSMRKTPLAPTNFAYTRHMRSVAQQGTLGELTAVALPCAWVYCIIGQHLLRHGEPPSTHPYKNWLMMYGSPEFAEVTRWLRMVLDREAQQAGMTEKDRMTQAFLISSRYEWMFWEMAWQEEQWPV